jgi:hypothetical protein
MLPFGHAGLVFLIGHALKFTRLIPVAFFSLLPDIIDKGFFFLGATTFSKGYSHTLLFAIVVAIALLLLQNLKKFKALGNGLQLPLAAAIGISSHIITDAFFVYTPILWPLQAFMPIVGAYKINPFTLQTVFEFIGIAAIAWVIWKRKVKMEFKELVKI